MPKFDHSDRITVGPITMTVKEWNDMFALTLRRHNDESVPAPVAWMEQFLRLASERGFVLQLCPIVAAARRVHRN
jgi:hypothetical protein